MQYTLGCCFNKDVVRDRSSDRTSLICVGVLGEHRRVLRLIMSVITYTYLPVKMPLSKMCLR